MAITERPFTVRTAPSSPSLKRAVTQEAVPAPHAPPRRTLLGYLAVPRPKDAFKALLMPIGFVLGVLATGGVSTHTVLRAAVAFAALELLLYPARYQWNDVRGFAADQCHPGAGDRGRLPGPVRQARRNVLASCLVALLRMAAVAGLALLLPGLKLGWILIALTAGVFGVAIVYEGLRSAGTGRTDEVPPPVRPQLALLWLVVGAGYVVRGMAGFGLAVDVSRRPLLAVAAVVTLWAYGTAFVTSRWAIEATAFAEQRNGLVVWSARADQAREHTLALARWLPRNVPADAAPGGLRGWAALRSRTPLTAPWNVAFLVAAVAAALTGRLLVAIGAPAGVPVSDALGVLAVGGLAALAVAVVPGHRVLALVAGAAALLAVLTADDASRPAAAVLPWLGVNASYAYFTRKPLHQMSSVADRVMTGVGATITALCRAVLGQRTWQLLVEHHGTGRG